MNKANVKVITPKIRFKEFRNSANWRIASLGTITIPVEERTKSQKYVLLSLTSGIGLVSQIEKFGREIAGKSYKNYLVIQKYDFAYNKSATKQYPEGFIAIQKDYDKAALPSSIFTCFRIIDNECVPEFFNYLFFMNYHGKWLKKHISVGARSHGALNVNTKYLWEMPIAIPPKKEQEKIANCLKSIDNVIQEEEAKLEQLNSHKKGLLQKLLPELDVNIPPTRFLEFSDGPSWKFSKLGDLCHIKTGKLDANAMVQNGKYRFYTCAREHYYIDEYAYDTDALLISGNGANVGYIHHYHGKFNAYQRTYILDAFQENIFFIKLFLEKYLAQRINVIHPIIKEEQEKIAGCISSIDELISAQTEKIEALKQHKKGLLQGLFPSLEEVLYE